jgi:hypothetical protein
MKMYELDQSVRQDITEGWSQKYKSSINCSHPKGFSQKAHCAGKKKHNESIEMEMTCPDCGMCQSHGTLNEIKKGQKDSNGFTKCWPGKHAEGTKKGKNGKPVRNCVPNESIEESKERCKQCGMTNCSCKPGTCKCKPIAGWIPNKGFKKAVKISELVNENDMASFFKDLQKNNPKFKNLRIHGDSEHDELRRQDQEKRDIERQAVHQRSQDATGQDHANLHQLEAEYEKMKSEYKALGGSSWQYADREQNLTASERKARGMEDGLNRLHSRIVRARKHGEQGISETATAGATSAANVGVGAVYKNKPVKQPKNKDGTAKNALDMKGANLLGGGSIKR